MDELGNDRRRTDPVTPVPLLVGQLLTAAWVVCVGLYTWIDWSIFRGLKPNEVGDFVAGAAAPLAFMWLVVAVFLQKEELGLQRSELRESREAQQKQAKETEALVVQNREAVRLAQATLEDQRRGEEEGRIERLIDMLAKRIVLRSPDLMIRKLNVVGDHRIFGNPTSQNDADEVFKIALTELTARAEQLSEGDVPINEKVLKEEVEGLLRWFNTIMESEQRGAFPVLRARIEMLELKRFATLIENLDCWLTRRRQ